MAASRGPKVFLRGPRNLGGPAWDRDATKGFLSGVPLGLVGTRGILTSDTGGGGMGVGVGLVLVTFYGTGNGSGERTQDWRGGGSWNGSWVDDKGRSLVFRQETTWSR